MGNEITAELIHQVRTPPCHVDEQGILYQSDFRDVLEDVPANSIDLIVTDPPYGINYQGCNLHQSRIGKQGSHRRKSMKNWVLNDSFHEALNLFECLLRHSSRVLKRGGCFCCCTPGGGRHSKVFTTWARLVDDTLSLKETVVWDKGRLGPGGHYRKGYEFILVGVKPGGRCTWNGGMTSSNIVRHRRVNRKASDHPTPKPESLMRHFIGLHSDEGDMVMDPFAGHGTTLVAAKQMNRRFLGIEIVPEYCFVAVERLNA